VRRIWEYGVNSDSYNSYFSFDAINDALSSIGSSLAAVFNNFTVANYVMSTSPTNDPYCYEEATSYPSVYIEGTINYSGNTVNYTPADGVGNYAADYIQINSTVDQVKVTVSGASSGITYVARVIGIQSGVSTVVDIPMSGSPLTGSVRISTASYNTVILIVENETPDSSTLTQSGYSVQVILPPTWESYKGGYPPPDGSGVQDDYFSDYDTEHTVYMYGTGFSSGTHKIIYWDGDGTKRTGEITSPVDGILKSQWTFTADNATAGNWHATVYKSGANPSSYSATDPDIVTDDKSYSGGYAFDVEESAIPEFPTVLAILVSFGLCAGIYLWMRRKVAPVRA
jgi:hypothetical protein